MSIDRKFEELIKSIMKAQADISAAVSHGDQRRWMDFKEIVEAGQFDLVSVGKIFSRESLNNLFASLLGKTGIQTKEFNVAKLSNDVLAGMERDYVSRTRSRIATIMHTASRARANGKPTGPLRRNTIDYLTRVADEDDATRST
jgi:hypothetical protein